MARDRGEIMWVSAMSRALLAVVVASSFSTRSGLAESWICSVIGKDLRITFVNGAMQVAESHSGASLNVLQNDEFAIIAEQHYGNFDPRTNGVVMWMRSVMLDKRSNLFAYTNAQIGSPVRQQLGQCRGYDEGRENSLPVAASPSWEWRDAEIKKSRLRNRQE